MSKTLYFATVNNGIVTNHDIARISFLMYGVILDDDNYLSIRKLAKNMKGILRELKHPSVKFLVEHGRPIAAVQLYKDLHGSTLQEAHDAVKKMVENINAVDRKDKK